jgi:hypothetical protein
MKSPGRLSSERIPIRASVASLQDARGVGGRLPGVSLRFTPGLFSFSSLREQ